MSAVGNDDIDRSALRLPVIRRVLIVRAFAIEGYPFYVTLQFPSYNTVRIAQEREHNAKTSLQAFKKSRPRS